jgi:hypothetical protein
VRRTARVPQLRIASYHAADDDPFGRDPLALLIAMLLDQQFPTERALGVASLPAAELAAADRGPVRKAGCAFSLTAK